MTKREQILVMAMAAAVVWGASSIVLGVMKDRHDENSPANSRLALLGFAETQRATLQQLRLAEREKIVLDEALAPWVTSPFLAEATRASLAGERLASFDYTGFMQVGDQQFAIVNGREYRVSDVVRSSDFVVESIHPDHVVLASGSGGRRVTVDLQTLNPERKVP